MAKTTITIEEKIKLLTLTSWSYKDIAAFMGCGKNKAIEIKKRGEAVKYAPHLVTVKSILALYDTTPEEQIKVLRTALGEEDDN